MFKSWSQIWQEQGLNADETGDLDPTLTEEQQNAQIEAVANDLEQNWEVEYERQEDGLEHPVLRRKF